MFNGLLVGVGATVLVGGGAVAVDTHKDSADTVEVSIVNTLEKKAVGLEHVVTLEIGPENVVHDVIDDVKAEKRLSTIETDHRRLLLLLEEAEKLLVVADLTGMRAEVFNVKVLVAAAVDALEIAALCEGEEPERTLVIYLEHLLEIGGVVVLSEEFFFEKDVVVFVFFLFDRGKCFGCDLLNVFSTAHY